MPAAEHMISAALLIFALLGAITSLFVPKVRIAAPNLVVSYNPIPTFRVLWRLISEKKEILYSILGISWFWFFGAAVLSILPVYCKDYLGVDEQVVTTFLAMFTVGIGLGSILCEKLSFKRVELGLVPIGSLGITIFLIDLSFCHPNWDTQVLGLKAFLDSGVGLRMMFDFLMMSVFGGFFILPLYTLIQERSHLESRSRVIAANNILNAVYMVVASLLVMVFNAYRLSFTTMFLILAVMNLGASAYIYIAVPEFMKRLREKMRVLF
jgi:hypothetical protein